MKAEQINGTVVLLHLESFTKEELIWLMNHGIINMTTARAELVRRGENEWKVVCELRAA